MRRTGVNMSDKTRRELDWLMAEDDCPASVALGRAIQNYAALRRAVKGGYGLTVKSPDGTETVVII